jgi:hypothetical protein
MGCARFTVVATRARAELHGALRYHFDQPLAADFLDVNFFSDPLQCVPLSD